jgi:poly-beta-1,6-N-acetyl-D-glucosamine synthase
MTALFTVIFLKYSVLVLVLAFGWAKWNDQAKNKTIPKNRSISVVVAFRNEGSRLLQLIEDLESQSYNKGSFEVILIDDHSEDGSLNLLKERNTQLNIKNLQLKDRTAGKKAALDAGIQQAIGEIIVTTDADCRLKSSWLTIINQQFGDEDIKLVTGLVRINESKSLFSRLQALEFSSLIGMTGATIGLGHPVMCNGANLAFLRSAYKEVDGYKGNENIPSGDDEFLMRKISARWSRSIGFMANAEAVVATAPIHSFSEWINQRLRWASKWKHNSSLFTQAIALIVLSFHLCFILFFILAVAGMFTLKHAFLLWGVKMFAEAIFLIPACSLLQLRWRWLSFLILQFSYSFYVVGIGILSQVRGYRWKGREWNP